jgi:hypothetical protein
MSDQQLEEIGAFDVLLNMFFIYNCILHSSIVVINLGIIFKEMEVEFFEMFTNHGDEGSDYNLAVNRVLKDIEEEMWYLDPIAVIKALFAFFLGETITEEIQKQPALDEYWEPLMTGLGDYADAGNPR